MQTTALAPVFSALVAGAAALLGVLLNQRQVKSTLAMQRQERLETERNRRREEAAQAVGPVLSLLTDANIARFVATTEFAGQPDQVLRELSERMLEHLLDVIDRWPAIREKLLILATSNPSTAINDLSLQVVEATSDLLGRCYLYFGQFSKIERPDPRTIPLAGGLMAQRRRYEPVREIKDPPEDQDQASMRAYNADVVMILHETADTVARKLLVAVRGPEG